MERVHNKLAELGIEDLNDLQPVPEGLVDEHTMCHGILVKDHGMMIEAMAWAWPKSRPYIGIAVVEMTEEEPVITRIRSDADTWIVIKVMNEHAVPVAFGENLKTVLSKEEIESMPWVHEWENREIREHPSLMTKEELENTPYVHIAMLRCKDCPRDLRLLSVTKNGSRKQPIVRTRARNH